MIRLVGTAAVAVIICLVAAAVTFGWQHWEQSIQAFEDADDFPSLTEDEGAMLRAALAGFRPYIRQQPSPTFCLPPVSLRADRAVEQIKGMAERVSSHGMTDAQYRELTARTVNNLHNDTYHRAALQSAQPASIEGPAGARFMIPRFWETASCSGWVEASTPQVFGEEALVYLGYEGNDLEIARCHKQLVFLRRNRRLNGEVLRDWSVSRSITENCLPVF